MYCIVDEEGSYEQRHETSNNVVCAPSKVSDQSAHMCRLIRAFESRSVKLLTGFSKLEKRLHRLVRVYTSQNYTLLEITRHSLILSLILLVYKKYEGLDRVK